LKSKSKPPVDKKELVENKLLKMQPLVRTLLKRSNGLSENGERASYAPWFKEAVYDLLNTPDVSFQEVCNLTGIPVKTLENFKEFTACIVLEKKPLSEFHQLIEDAWEKAFDCKKKD
jgi:hypothetical protein